jgi:hypothetical protein
MKFWHRLANFYEQDQSKAMLDLSLTFGLRYDFDVFPSAADVRHRQAAPNQRRRNNLSDYC